MVRFIFNNAALYAGSQPIIPRLPVGNQGKGFWAGSRQSWISRGPEAAPLSRWDPDLQKPERLLLRRIELAVEHPGAGSHPLNLARMQYLPVPEGILMGNRP
jgi:hypothetical protein